MCSSVWFQWVASETHWLISYILIAHALRPISIDEIWMTMGRHLIKGVMDWSDTTVHLTEAIVPMMIQNQNGSGNVPVRPRTKLFNSRFPQKQNPRNPPGVLYSVYLRVEKDEVRWCSSVVQVVKELQLNQLQLPIKPISKNESSCVRKLTTPEWRGGFFELPKQHNHHRLVRFSKHCV